MSPVRQLWRWADDPLGLLDEAARDFGDVFRLDLWKLAPRTIVFSHPRAIEEIFTAPVDDLYAGEPSALFETFVGKRSLFVLDGAPHATHRRFVMPAFHGSRIRLYADFMLDAIDRVVDGWVVGRRLSLHDATKKIVLEVIVRSLFGTRAALSLAGLEAQARTLIESAAKPHFLIPALRVDLGPWSPWGRIVRFMRDLDGFVLGEIARARAEADPSRTDLLAMLVAARDEGGQLSQDELRDEIVTLLIGGADTTASTLAWLFADLLRHPEVMRELTAEVDRVTGGRPLASEHVPALDRLDAALKESQRLHPVVPNAIRLLKRPMRIGGWDLPEGVEVLPSMYLTQRRADLYPEPTRFVADRFLHKKASPYELFPFGGGPRLCVGRAFALHEIKTVVARLLQRVTLRDGAPGEPLRATRRGITVAPADGVPAVVEALR